MLAVCVCLYFLYACVCSMDLLLLAATTHDPTIEISDPIVDYDYREKLLRLLLWML